MLQLQSLQSTQTACSHRLEFLYEPWSGKSKSRRADSNQKVQSANKGLGCENYHSQEKVRVHSSDDSKDFWHEKSRCWYCYQTSVWMKVTLLCWPPPLLRNRHPLQRNFLLHARSDLNLVQTIIQRIPRATIKIQRGQEVEMCIFIVLLSDLAVTADNG